MMKMTMIDIDIEAQKIVDQAGSVGGIDEVRRLAERGWPETRSLEKFGLADADALRKAVQECAKDVVAQVEAE